MGAACWRLGAGCLGALSQSGPASGLFTGLASTFLKCNSIQDHLARVLGYQEVQNIELTCPSKIQRSLEHFQEGNLDQPEPQMPLTTQVLLPSGGHQLSFVVKKMYRPLWCREQCKTLAELLLVGQKHSFSNLLLENVTKIFWKQVETPDATSNAHGLDDQ